MAVTSITDADFETEVVNSDTPVLVDFWAEWCGPCKALAPTLDEVSDALDGKVKIVKINIEENPEAPTKLGVRSIPALFVFKGGEAVANRAGALPKDALIQWIEEAI